MKCLTEAQPDNPDSTVCDLLRRMLGIGFAGLRSTLRTQPCRDCQGINIHNNKARWVH